MSFHVPELSRDTTHYVLATTAEDGNNGCFRVPSPEPNWMLALICSDGDGWEHVSVHAYRQLDPASQRTPNWREMAHVKRLFWDADDVAIQIYPKQSEYVNCHPHVLHWWRPTFCEIPTPPSILVGI